MLFSETPSAPTLKLLLEEAEENKLHVSIVDRLKVILFFVDHQHSITQTCRHFGISRSTFHRWVERFDPKNILSLQDRSHDPFSLRQSTVSAEAVELIRRYRMRYTQMGKEKISELLALDHGIQLSPSTIGRVIERECLYFADTPFHWKKRIVLNEHQRTDVMIPQHQSYSPVLESEYPEEPLNAESPESRKRTKFSDANIEYALPRIRRFGFWKFLLISSVISNIVFASAMIGIALFEHSTAQTTVASDREQINTIEVLHTAPSTISFP